MTTKANNFHAQNTFNLTISDPVELKAAETIIVEQYNAVQTNNAAYEEGLSNFVQTLYPFSHLPTEKMLELYGGARLDELQLSTRAFHWNDATECENLPAYKNWVEEGKVGPVKDQGQCGSCYMISAITALESAAAIEHGTSPIHLSEQVLQELAGVLQELHRR
jgi:C1A family cysteine protease